MSLNVSDVSNILSPPVCTRCSKAENIEFSHSRLLIHFNTAFYIGKFDFFFDITVVYIEKKNHLLRNLFFYASAVNVHIVAV